MDETTGNINMNSLQGVVGRETTTMAWYLVHCKPRQDERAEEHLTRQSYSCYRPQMSCERLVRGRRQTMLGSMFPGYIFIQLQADANWSALRSTRGVHRLVSFGGYPLRVPVSIIDSLKQRTLGGAQPMLQPGDPVRILDGAYAELDAIFQRKDGEARVILLMSMLNRQQQLCLPLAGCARINTRAHLERADELQDKF